MQINAHNLFFVEQYLNYLIMNLSNQIMIKKILFPKDNKNLTINYDKLYQLDNKDEFVHLKYKIYSTIYKEYSSITFVNLLYFIPFLK